MNRLRRRRISRWGQWIFGLSLIVWLTIIGASGYFSLTGGNVRDMVLTPTPAVVAAIRMNGWNPQLTSIVFLDANPAPTSRAFYFNGIVHERGLTGIGGYRHSKFNNQHAHQFWFHAIPFAAASFVGLLVCSILRIRSPGISAFCCVYCDYDLRGTNPAHACPECGKSPATAGLHYPGLDVLKRLSQATKARPVSASAILGAGVANFMGGFAVFAVTFNGPFGLVEGFTIAVLTGLLAALCGQFNVAGCVWGSVFFFLSPTVLLIYQMTDGLFLMWACSTFVAVTASALVTMAISRTAPQPQTDTHD